MAQRPTIDQGLLSNEASQSQTSHSVGILWLSDQLGAETPTWQHTTPKR